MAQTDISLSTKAPLLTTITKLSASTSSDPTDISEHAESFYKAASLLGYMDTGLLPVNGSGVLSIRKAMTHLQVAYQVAPQVSTVRWTDREGSHPEFLFDVAQPYVIWIADFQYVNGNTSLVGARMWYSPEPITHPNQPLYHINLPNINCLGYRGTGVGWTCLYHQGNTNFSGHPNLANLITAVAERMSGAESYNQNMTETDGVGFYSQYYHTMKGRDCPEFISSYPNENVLISSAAKNQFPYTWQQKTQDEGIDWTLDTDLWLPVMVSGPDAQGQHSFEEDAIPLTFEVASLGYYNAYYSDPWDSVKPSQAITRLRAEGGFDWTTYVKMLSTAADGSLSQITPPVFFEGTHLSFKCKGCSAVRSQSDRVHPNFDRCKSCWTTHDYKYCTTCTNLRPRDKTFRHATGRMCVSCLLNISVEVWTCPTCLHIWNPDVGPYAESVIKDSIFMYDGASSAVNEHWKSFHDHIGDEKAVKALGQVSKSNLEIKSKLHGNGPPIYNIEQESPSLPSMPSSILGLSSKTHAAHLYADTPRHYGPKLLERAALNARDFAFSYKPTDKQIIGRLATKNQAAIEAWFPKLGLSTYDDGEIVSQGAGFGCTLCLENHSPALSPSISQMPRCEACGIRCYWKGVYTVNHTGAPHSDSPTVLCAKCVETCTFTEDGTLKVNTKTFDLVAL